MIRFDHVSKHFGSTAAVSDVHFEVDKGDFVFLIGPSGAGKTTLLRLIIHDLIPSEGKVTVDHWEIGSLKPSKIHLLRRSVGMVFQDFKLLADRTVFENIAIALEILGKKEKDIEKRVSEVIDLVGLKEKHNLFPQQLSAGQMQRVGIARAIVAGPNILLSDEPTGNLDQETADEIMEVLNQINKLGTTIIMATHNSHVVNSMKKRTIALDQGKIISDEQKGSYSVSHKDRGKKHHGST